MHDQGYAFVALADGRQVLLPRRALEGMSFADLQPGQWLECDIEESETGLRLVRAHALSSSALFR